MGKRTELTAGQADDEFLLESEFPIDKTTPPSDGDAPVYDEASGKYIPTPVAGGHARLHNIESPLDHNITGTPARGDTIIYTGSEWLIMPFDVLKMEAMIEADGDIYVDSTGAYYVKEQ